MSEYSQGVYHAVLKDGQMMTVEQIVADLNVKNDLLEALEAMVESYEYEASAENPSLLKARAAIAKARGEK